MKYSNHLGSLARWAALCAAAGLSLSAGVTSQSWTQQEDFSVVPHGHQSCFDEARGIFVMLTVPV